MIKSFIEYRSTLTEAPYLDPSELKKDASGGPNKGRARTEILAAKIKNSEPLTLKTGEEFLVTDIESALASIEQFKRDGKSFKLIGKNKEISSSQIKKTEDFGGGSGAGGGTINTAYREAAQCVWTQALLEKGSAKTHEDISVNDLTKAFNSKYVSLNINKTPLENILDIGDAWNKSSFLTAQFIINDLKLKKNQMVFHHDDDFMNKIYSLKTKAFNNDGLANMTNDKWNPGDIWLSTPDFNLDSLDISSIEALNNSILEVGGYTNKSIQLIGISLKAIKNAVTKVVMNVNPASTPKYKFVAGKISSNKGTWDSSKQSYLYFKQGESNFKADIRTNSALSTHKVELIVKGARGGGAGWGELMNLSKEVYKKTLPSNIEIRDFAEKIVSGNSAAVEKFIELLQSIDSNISAAEIKRKLKQHDDDLKALVWIHSKLGGLYIIQLFVTGTQKQADRFISGIINYGSSQSSNSSAHIVLKQG